jgi:hypothetical protein
MYCSTVFRVMSYTIRTSLVRNRRRRSANEHLSCQERRLQLLRYVNERQVSFNWLQHQTNIKRIRNTSQDDLPAKTDVHNPLLTSSSCCTVSFHRLA